MSGGREEVRGEKEMGEVERREKERVGGDGGMERAVNSQHLQPDFRTIGMRVFHVSDGDRCSSLTPELIDISHCPLKDPLRTIFKT